MKRTVFLLSSLALAALSVPVEGNQTGPAPPRETKDRLPLEQLEDLVAGPMRTASKGDLPRAQQAFELLVEKSRRRHDGVREADLLMAFGVQLFTRGGELDREDMLKLSPAYVARAIEVTRRAFGPDHPETALALHTYGDLLVELQPDDPPEAAEAALAEALSIRQATLGADNHETLAAMRALARVKAARFRTSGKLDEAAELFHRAIEASERSAPFEYFLKPVSLRLDLVRAYAKAGRIDDAVREARIVTDQAADDDGECGFAAVEGSMIAESLEAERPADAEILRGILSSQVDCLKQIMEQLEKEAAAQK
ncbi:MAG: tetratricopeptide repeat protein [Allosphingosinicella sp.]